MLSLGSASHPPPRRLNTNRTLKREGSTIEGHDTTEEVPPKTERAAAPSSDTPRLHKKPEADTTPRAAGKCCALFERCPKGNHSVLNLTRATPRDPKAPRPRSPRPAQSSAHSRTRGRRFLGRWRRGHPPAAPAQAALSLGRLPTAIGDRGGQAAFNTERSTSRPARPTATASSTKRRAAPRRATRPRAMHEPCHALSAGESDLKVAEPVPNGPQVSTGPSVGRGHTRSWSHSTLVERR